MVPQTYWSPTLMHKTLHSEPLSPCLLEPLHSSSSPLHSVSSFSIWFCPSAHYFLSPHPSSPQPSNPGSLLPSLHLTSLSEHGPQRIPISLVCRRLQRLLRLADPPGQGQRVARSSSPSSSSSAAIERHSQRAAAAVETQPPTGYPPAPAALAVALPCHIFTLLLDTVQSKADLFLLAVLLQTE